MGEARGFWTGSNRSRLPKNPHTGVTPFEMPATSTQIEHWTRRSIIGSRWWPFAVATLLLATMRAPFAAGEETSPPIQAEPAKPESAPPTVPPQPGGEPKPAAESKTPGPQAEKEAKDREAMRDTAARARSLAQKGDFENALKVVEEWPKRSSKDAFYYELKGTVQTLAKDYEGAETSFTKMLEQQPTSYVALFNRAETIMLQGRYAKAEAEFEKVEQDRSGVDAPVADLARFKRVACLLAQTKLPAADLLVPPIQENNESPALYYSRAMIRWVRKDIPGATKLLSEARTHFSPDVDNLYTDTFVEFGWGRRDETGQFVFAPKFR